MLGWVVGKHWHALVRDVLALGYKSGDMFKSLDLAEMLSIVVAAPPGSSVRFALDEGWSRTDHLLANLQEGNAGLADLTKPYERPGQRAGTSFGNADVMTWEEMDEMDRRRASQVEVAQPASNVRVF